MADADEDAIPTSWSQRGEEELDDETQDFRFLAQLVSSSSNGQPQSTIPKRGTKDFEPNTTRSQSNALDASRSAMHNALSALRVHSSKNHIVGLYLPDERDWKWEGHNARCVVVHKFKSTHGRVMGRADFRNWVWFLPEEALYLLERGTLDIRWPDLQDQAPRESPQDVSDLLKNQVTDVGLESFQEQSSVGSTMWNEEKETSSQTNDENDIDAENHIDAVEQTTAPLEELLKIGELPMSLQGAYSSFIGKNGLSLERYVVYASLKRLGYIVQRATTWDAGEDVSNGRIDSTTSSQLTITSKSAALARAAAPSHPTNRAVSLIYRLLSWLFTQQDKSCPAYGPLISPGLYRSYNDIFRDLALISYHHHHSSHTSSSLSSSEEPLTSTYNSKSPKPPFTISFDVWKPNTKYRKSAPPPPDYRVAVIDARSSTIPAMDQIGDLLDSMPPDELPPTKRIEARLKYGKRNVLLAIVDGGVISYLRFSDAEFGSAKLYDERKAIGYGKGKGEDLVEKEEEVKSKKSG